MASIEDRIKGDLGKGIALGIGAALILPAALPALAKAARPWLRSAVKSSVLLLEVGRETLAEASEALEDIVAEVHAELAERHEQMAESATAAAEAAVAAAESEAVDQGA
jgi:hypothetical protein